MMKHWVVNCSLIKGGNNKRSNFHLVPDSPGQPPTRAAILGALGVDESQWDISDETTRVIQAERVVRYACRLEKKKG